MACALRLGSRGWAHAAGMDLCMLSRPARAHLGDAPPPCHLGRTALSLADSAGCEQAYGLMGWRLGYLALPKRAVGCGRSDGGHHVSTAGSLKDQMLKAQVRSMSAAGGPGHAEAGASPAEGANQPRLPHLAAVLIKRSYWAASSWAPNCSAGASRSITGTCSLHAGPICCSHCALGAKCLEHAQRPALHVSVCHS